MPNYKLMDMRTREQVGGVMEFANHTSAEENAKGLYPSLRISAVLLPSVAEILDKKPIKKRARRSK